MRIGGLFMAIAIGGVASVGWASGHGAPAKPAGGHGGGGHGGHGAATKHGEPEPAPDATKSGTNGVDLGEFRVKVYHPAESQKSTTNFALYATVAKDKVSESRDLAEHRLHKVRDQILMVTRLMPLGDFNDPELKNFRRRILLQLRRTMPELGIENVYVSDFQLAVERI